MSKFAFCAWVTLCRAFLNFCMSAVDKAFMECIYIYAKYAERREYARLYDEIQYKHDMIVKSNSYVVM